MQENKLDKEYKNPNILKIDRQKQWMFDYRRQFISTDAQARGQLFINSVTLYAYHAADVMENDHYEGIRAWPFGSCPEVGYFTRETS